MTNREKFIKVALSKMGAWYQWDGKGPDVFDCSGLVAFALKEAGGPDVRDTFNAQKMWDSWPLPSMMTGAGVMPGDLCLYGDMATGRIWHVMLAVGVGGLVFGAAGGDHTTTSIAEAQRRGARVQLWESKDSMSGFAGYRRIPWVNS